MNALRDENNVPSRLACLNTDTEQGTNLIRLSVTRGGRLRVTTNQTLNFSMRPIDPRDENYVGCWLFEGTDGLTYPAVADSLGRLLINI